MTASSGNATFESTRWSLVARASQPGDSPFEESDRRQALDDLCAIYWTPLFVFARRQGLSPQDAEDVVQGFFARILERDFPGGANPGKGRLRSYLLTGLKRHISNHHRALAAKKRGGGAHRISIEAEETEGGGSWEIVGAESSDAAFDRRWACALLEHAMVRLRTMYAARGQEKVFDQVSLLLTPGTGVTTAEVAERLHQPEGTVRVTLSRMRKRFGEIVRDEIEATLLPGEDVDAELNFLLATLSR